MSSSISSFVVERGTPASRFAVPAAVALVLGLAFAPIFLNGGSVDRLTVLFIYVVLATMWNALAGFGGLISIGQQAFFGIGAYFTIRLADAGIDPFLAVFVAALGAALIALPVSFFMLRLKGGEFAIGMWVVASLIHLLVNLDPLINGETGQSLVALNRYEPGLRRATIYWLALASAAGLLTVLILLLRSRVGSAIQAIRDNEEAAASVGVRVLATKRVLFLLAAFGTAVAGALWLATAVSFQPKTYFSVQWTAYMIFMVLVGGIGRLEGSLLGAVVFFAIETWFGALGVGYLIGLGAAAVIFSLLLPRGLWGEMERRWGVSLMPVGFRLVLRVPVRPEDTPSPARKITAP